MDVLQAIRNLKPLCQRHTRLLMTTYNHLWEPLVTFAESFGMKVPRTEQNWLSIADIRNLLKLAGFEALETYRIVLLPKYLPLLSGFLNRVCARLPFLGKLCMTQVVVARMAPPSVSPERLTVSVVIPCKNEKGNVEDAVRRIPRSGWVERKSSFVTINRPMGRPRKCCESSRVIRKRRFALSMVQEFVSHETSGQVSMRRKATF